MAVIFWLIKLSEERLRERLRVGASAGMGELARVIDEVASLVEEWRLGEAVHMSLHLRVSLLLRKSTANLTHKSSIYTS